MKDQRQYLKLGTITIVKSTTKTTYYRTVNTCDIKENTLALLIRPNAGQCKITWSYEANKCRLLRYRDIELADIVRRASQSQNIRIIYRILY